MQPPLIPQVVPWLGDTERKNVSAVVDDIWLTEGPRSKAFSDRLNTLFDVPHGVFAPNGTLALALGLMSMGIGPGDEVIVPDCTFIGSANAVLMVGGNPVFVDVDPVHFLIDPDLVEAAITPRTRAIMPVHLFGGCADMTSINDIARRHDLKVIEDAAQAVAVTWRGKPAGGLGDIGCFSFFADKTITTGEGGYICCRDDALHEKLQLLRNQGRIDRGSFIHAAVGYNFRITDMQAAVGLAQLDRLDDIVRNKQRIWETMRAGLEDLRDVRLVGPAPGSTFVPFRTVLIGERMTELTQHLESAGVQTRSFFHPLHRQPCFTDLTDRFAADALSDARFPNSNYGWDHGICLPVFPTLTDEQIDRMIGAIRGFYGG